MTETYHRQQIAYAKLQHRNALLALRVSQTAASNAASRVDFAIEQYRNWAASKVDNSAQGGTTNAQATGGEDR